MLSGAATVLASTALVACTQASGVDGDGEDAGTATAAIIDGVPATDARYGAVGALVYMIPEVGVLDTFCSGTLIAPRAIVTARHCTRSIDLALENGLIPAFAFGSDAFAPTELVPIVDYLAAPPGDAGLLLDGGRDVAVAHLASVPTGARPARLGLWENKMLGGHFQIAGYGINDAQGFYGSKLAGGVTARATKGRWYELLFKSYPAYRQWYFTDSALAARTEEEARSWWYTYRLETDYELLAGGLYGDAVGCNGDSGGPLLRGTSAHDLTVYGVSFAVENTISTSCGLGGGYLVFNRKMLDFVKRAI